MGSLKRLFGLRPDPTRAWVAVQSPPPDFDVERMRFGALGFGDAMDVAAFLGRPDRLEWTQLNYCCLLYASGGFQIDFDASGFAYLAFFIGPDDWAPKHAALQFSSPRLQGLTPDGIRLTGEFGRMAVEQVFGAPDAADTEPDEVLLFYHRQSVTMEFELNGMTGKLKRWSLYPEWS